MIAGKAFCLLPVFLKAELREIISEIVVVWSRLEIRASNAITRA